MLFRVQHHVLACWLDVRTVAGRCVGVGERSWGVVFVCMAEAVAGGGPPCEVSGVGVYISREV